MNAQREQSIRRIMSREARGAGASLLRAGLAIIEPFYAGAMRLRNGLYNIGLKRAFRLGRPVISVGNITTGGTGKTPVVQWIARQLLETGHRPACLIRGYMAGNNVISDEATLLAESLGIPVEANPDRVAGAEQLLREHPETDVILLDDAFQHRRVQRDLDIVLIDATNPFGYGHVLPRGLLREPPAGLRRASLIILTRSDQIAEDALADIEMRVRRHNRNAPILRSTHRLTRFVPGQQSYALHELTGKRVFCFCGIGNPESFQRQLLAAGAVGAGTRFFGDHHHYTQQDVETLQREAAAVNAEMLITTDKDWVKIRQLDVPVHPPILRAELELSFSRPEDAQMLMGMIHQMIPVASSPA